MLFEMWLKGQGYDLKKLTKKEGGELYREFGKVMAPAVRDCTNFWNATMKKSKRRKSRNEKARWK